VLRATLRARHVIYFYFDFGTLLSDAVAAGESDLDTLVL
jgi:hypothetical protein